MNSNSNCKKYIQRCRRSHHLRQPTHERSGGWSALHCIPIIGRENKDINTKIHLSYLLTCNPPANVNGITNYGDFMPMIIDVSNSSPGALKILIDFNGDCTLKTSSYARKNPNRTSLDSAKEQNSEEMVKMLAECY